MVYEHFNRIDKQTALNELEGRIEKLERDRDASLAKADAYECDAAEFRIDASHYDRLVGEYKDFAAFRASTSQRKA